MVQDGTGLQSNSQDLKHIACHSPKFSRLSSSLLTSLLFWIDLGHIFVRVQVDTTYSMHTLTIHD